LPFDLSEHADIRRLGRLEGHDILSSQRSHTRVVAFLLPVGSRSVGVQ